MTKVVEVTQVGATHAAVRGSIPCSDLALNSRECVYLCLSDETLKAVGQSLLFGVYAGGRKISHKGSWTSQPSLEKDNSLSHSCVSPSMGCLHMYNYELRLMK